MPVSYTHLIRDNIRYGKLDATEEEIIQAAKAAHVHRDVYKRQVLRMIQKTIENGHKGGAWVGICGELGADIELTETFLKMGVDELSVSPTFVLPVRDKVRSLYL